MRTRPDSLRTIRQAFVVLLISCAVGCGDGDNSPASPPSQLGASQCPDANPSETGPCGPTYVLPSWGDAGGWKDASHYGTISSPTSTVTARRSCSAAQRPGSL